MSLKKIAVARLSLGMYLVKLEGSWVDHPFWRTRFLLQDPLDLHKLQSCGVQECWIDTSRGADVATAAAAVGSAVEANSGAAETQGAQALPKLDSADADALPSPRNEQSRPMSAELREAAAICERGRSAVIDMFGQARMGRSVDPQLCLPLVQDIAASVSRNAGALVSLSRLKTRDNYSYMHSVAVCALMVSLARQLGMDEEHCREAGMAGLMHDIGKAVMPESVLQKPGRLTDSETQVMRTHPERGHELLVEGGAASASTLDVVLHHHERMDGQGYPHKLAGEGISLLARMGALCDVYDAVTSNRPYKMGWDPAESLARMASWQGQFDSGLLAALVQSLGIYPTGSLVRLESQRLAVVLEQNPHALGQPKVSVFYSLRSKMQIEPRAMDLAAPGCHDRIAARAPRNEGEFERLDELWADAETLRRVRSSASQAA